MAIISNHNHTDAYLGSAMPYVMTRALAEEERYKIEFPNVTRFVVISNVGVNPLRVGFTEAGVLDATGEGRFYLLYSGETTTALDIKCIDLWLYAELETEFSLIAGYTNIPRKQYPNIAGYDGV